MKSQLFRVKIPFSDDIIFSDIGVRRDMIMLFDFILASAAIHFKRREQVPTDGILLYRSSNFFSELKDNVNHKIFSILIYGIEIFIVYLLLDHWLSYRLWLHNNAER